MIIGGGYGTGREVVEFFTSHGILGGLKGLTLAAAIFVLVLALTFEFARLFRTYDYVSFFKELIGPYWVLFEILYLLMFFLVLGVVSSAASSVLEQRAGVPAELGLALMLALVAILVGLGRGTVERALTLWFLVMYVVFIAYFVQIMGAGWGSVTGELSQSSTASSWWQGGLLYPMYNLAAVPALLFTARHMNTRRETFGAALATAVLVMLPAVMFHLSYAQGYPAVLDQPVPNYWMIEQFASPMLLTAFVVALFGTLVQTGVGLIHGVIERLEAMAGDRQKSLGSWGRVAIAVVALCVSGLFGSLGIIDLIGKGYALMGLGFALVYILPVCTLGLRRLAGDRGDRTKCQG